MRICSKCISLGNYVNLRGSGVNLFSLTHTFIIIDLVAAGLKCHCPLIQSSFLQGTTEKPRSLIITGIKAKGGGEAGALGERQPVWHVLSAVEEVHAEEGEAGVTGGEAREGGQTRGGRCHVDSAHSDGRDGDGIQNCIQNLHNVALPKTLIRATSH